MGLGGLLSQGWQCDIVTSMSESHVIEPMPLNAAALSAPFTGWPTTPQRDTCCPTTETTLQT